MVTITNFKDFNDEIKRTNCLQSIEKVATTAQLEKLEKLTNDKDMVAMLDALEI
ncbi:hypothetical protein JJL45_09165 [Tamlana sp. s12]|uniref:hypothetical protein n=1 Tax=Tamlana sp. s12 TaxID=1630406 RepID=UPI000A870CA6|nr:hypothetical protein [Tamlana sp. s12]QQY81099.1 hypothetical protein JJL45_09165 [Tamlana sp. s12]